MEAGAHERGVKQRVRFLGWQDNLVPYLTACDVFVYPAKQDDVGDAVVEAWAAARAPVIAADSLGPGLLIKHKQNGFLVPIGDAISMVEAIKLVVADVPLIMTLRGNGIKAFTETFAMDKVAPQYLDLLQRITAKSGAPSMQSLMAGP
jgi:glycosyltransferase involved in cell wall biosynthesis